MTVFNVLVTVVLNVEASTAHSAERAAAEHVERTTGGSVVPEGLDPATFRAEHGTEPDLRAEGTS